MTKVHYHTVKYDFEHCLTQDNVNNIYAFCDFSMFVHSVKPFDVGFLSFVNQLVAYWLGYHRPELVIDAGVNDSLVNDLHQKCWG